jgi:uncharacterized membrane protein required for colicin V production
VAAVLLVFLLCGAARGLFQSVAGLVVIIVALAGAGIFASALTPRVAEYVQPYIEKQVEARIDKALSKGGNSASSSAQEPAAGSSQAGGSQAGGSQAGAASDSEGGEENDAQQKAETQHLLDLLGLDKDPVASLEQSVQEKVHDTGVSVMNAVVESISETIIHVLLFLLIFAVLMLLLKALMHAMDLVLRLPGLHFFNRLGGAAFGLAEGALVLFLAIWILRRFGVSFDNKMVESTILLRFFTTHTPLSALSFL